MKKTYPFLFVAMAATTIMVSCDDDDNGVDTGGSDKEDIVEESGILSSKSFYDIDGQRVRSVGTDFRCSYDEKGDLASYYIGDGYLDLQLKPFKLSFEDYSEDHGEEESLECEFKFNSKGLISKIESTFYYSSPAPGYEDESGDGTMELSYNDNNQLTEISVNSESDVIINGKKTALSLSETATFSYSGTVLKKVTVKGKKKEGGKTYSLSFIYTFNYEKDNENKYYQYSPKYSGVLFGSVFDGLAFIGMFGKASYALPDYIDYTIDEGVGQYQGTERCSYSFNSNGSIRTADGYNYSYTTVGTRSVEEMVQEYIGEKKARKSFGLFKHRHHRK